MEEICSVLKLCAHFFSDKMTHANSADSNQEHFDQSQYVPCHQICTL